MTEPLAPGWCAQVACLWEATARKPGNVHRYRDFDDSGYTDFLLSAVAIGCVLERAAERGVGRTILEGMRATRRLVSTNTNLGILLLLAPLSAVPRAQPVRAGIRAVLDRLDQADAQCTYEAIRLAAPGGLGRVPEQDVHTDPTVTLGEAMALAANHDLIARQYTTGFADTFGDGLEGLRTGWKQTRSIEGGIITAHLQLLARHPDSLIMRKCGRDVAVEASRRAAGVLAAGWPHERSGQAAYASLDDWLRADGRARNPGATADLVTASLFVALREGIMTLPAPLPWSLGADHHG